MRLHCTAGLSTEFPFSDSSILLSPNSSLLLVAHHIAHIQTNKYSTSQHRGTILPYSHTHYILLQYHAVPCRAIQGAGSKSKSRIGRKVFFVKSGNVWNTTPLISYNFTNTQAANPIGSTQLTSRQQDKEYPEPTAWSNTLLSLKNLRKVKCNAMSGYLFRERNYQRLSDTQFFEKCFVTYEKQFPMGAAVNLAFWQKVHCCLPLLAK